MKIDITKNLFSYRKLPKNIDKLNISNFFHELKKYIPSSHIRVVKDVYLINQNLISFKTCKIFSNYTHYPNNKKLDVAKLAIKNIINSRFEDKQTHEEGIWIFDDKANIYYHWLLDSLQRYILIPKEFKNFPILIPASYNFPWVIEHLNFLGLKYILLESNKKNKIKKILIPSYSAPSGNFNKTVLHQLQKLFLDKNSEINFDNKKERIWIDRVDTRREITNRHEIEKVLKKFDFYIINPTNLKIEDMIKLINNAKVIAGPHGSGLANALFAQKNTTLIDIREKDDNFRNALFSMASDLGLNYYCLNETILDQKTEKVYLNPKVFEKFLLEILKK